MYVLQFGFQVNIFDSIKELNLLASTAANDYKPVTFA
jgi:hypothetical protein